MSAYGVRGVLEISEECDRETFEGREDLLEGLESVWWWWCVRESQNLFRKNNSSQISNLEEKEKNNTAGGGGIFFHVQAILFKPC